MAADISAWFGGRLPEEWTVGELSVTVDREEIAVVVPIAAPEEKAADAAARAASEAGRIARWREDTREQRMAIADAAQERYGRSVAWGAVCGDVREIFTNQSVPVMTRLRQPERLVLDTLVDAGVARSRSEALVWAVRLVGQHAEQWLTELREAMASVEEVRARGPEAS